MKEYICRDDLSLINFILERGGDVTIKKTDEEILILNTDYKVMSTKIIADLNEQ